MKKDISTARVRSRPRQTVTDFGITRIVDFIMNDTNAPAQHFSSSGAQLEVARVDSNGDAMDALTFSAPTTQPALTGFATSAGWTWEDTGGDVYTAQSGKFYNGAPTSGEEVMTTTSWGSSTSKEAEKLARFTWEIDLSWQNDPHATSDEINAGLDFLVRAFRYGGTQWHLSNSNLYAFLSTVDSQTPAVVASPIHNGTTDWTISASITRDRTNHPHRFTINTSFSGPSAGTAVKGVYVGIGAITDSTRRIIYGKAEDLTITDYSPSLTFEFTDF